MQPIVRVAFFIAASFAVISCHGATTGLPVGASGGGVGTASFTINVPAATPGSTGPQSAAITLLGANGAPSGVGTSMNLTASTPNCSKNPAGGLTCVVHMTAPAGGDRFMVATYAGTGSSGTRLSNDEVDTAVAVSKNTTCTKTATTTNAAPPSAKTTSLGARGGSL